MVDSDYLSVVAAKICTNHFDWRFATILVFNSTLIYGIDTFMKYYDKNVLVMHGTDSYLQNYEGQVRQFVVFGMSTSNIQSMLDWMAKQNMDNTGRYVIICDSPESQHCNERETVNILWKYKITNVVLLQHSSNDKKVDAFSYDLDKKTCGNSLPVNLNITSCPVQGYNKQCSNLFPLKFTNLHKCLLIVSTFEQMIYMALDSGVPSGSDGDVLRLIAEGLNASLRVVVPCYGKSFGFPDEHGNWSGSFGDIFNGYANISMTSAAITLIRNKYFQMSTEYDFKIFVLVTHPSIKQTSALKLLQPFQFTTHLAVVLSLLLVTVVAIVSRFRIWKRVSEILNIKDDQESIIFNSWIIFMGLPLQNLPDKSALVHIFLLWVWYCFLVRCYYQACLIYALKNDVYSADFLNLRDILESKYLFGGVVSLKDYFHDEPHIYNNWVGIRSQDVMQTFLNLSSGEKFSFVINTDFTEMFQAKFKKKLHVVPEKMVVSPKVVYFQKYSPLAEPVNVVIKRLVECGLVDKFKKQYTIPKVLYKKETTVQALNLNHYAGCYMLLLGGWLCSLLVFVLEMIYDKLYVKVVIE